MEDHSIQLSQHQVHDSHDPPKHGHASHNQHRMIGRIISKKIIDFHGFNSAHSGFVIYDSGFPWF